MDTLTPVKGRFILDLYKMQNGQAVPLSDFELKKFSSIEQAKAVFSLMPQDPRISQVSIVANLGDVLPDASVRKNYRSPDDPDFLDCFAIKCTVTLPPQNLGDAPISGPMFYNVGELLWQRQLNGGGTLQLDSLGQLHFA